MIPKGKYVRKFPGERLYINNFILLVFNLIPENKISPKKGRLLISEPFLDDPYFKRTVVLLCEHNEEGSFGFVLNRYVDVNMAEIMESFPEISAKISLGGPVQNRNLFYIHTLGELVDNSERINEDLFIGGDFEKLRLMIETGQVEENSIRFFVGYSGWGQNQLDQEMKENTWFVAENNTKLMMDTHNDKLWADILNSMGSDFARMANFPKDPKLN